MYEYLCCEIEKILRNSLRFCLSVCLHLYPVASRLLSKIHCDVCMCLCVCVCGGGGASI